MKIVKTYSFKDGEKFVKKNHSAELTEIIEAIERLNAVSCLTKESKEKTMRGQLLFSPVDMNDYLKLSLHKQGWTLKAVANKKKVYAEPRHAFGHGRFREMDGIKNKVGLEIQFGKYAFMGYDIFSKMIIFKNLGYIECGIEVVPTSELVKEMSTGVSDFDQLLVDFKHRGESNIDIPVFVIGLGLTDEERKEASKLQTSFVSDREGTIKRIKLKIYNGSPPGPKSE